MRTVCAAFLTLFVVACGPTVNAGNVTSTRDAPAHDYTYLLPIYTGSTCISTGGKYPTRVCTPHYMYLPQTGHEPEHCFVTLTSGTNESQEHEIPCPITYEIGQWVTLK